MGRLDLVSASVVRRTAATGKGGWAMRRVVVISDLHIGGADKPMLGHPEVLTDFLNQVAAHPGRGEMELVIAGDFIDFLAEEPLDAWTATENGALEKLETIFARNAELFDGFARCAQNVARFTILLGNHDIELAYPRVRDALFRRLQTGPHRCHFIQGNEAYRIGDLLIEHGNRYDSWNAIDHDGLRQIVSCASRGAIPPRELAICPGSLLVHGAMNPLKERYHFIDLLKPETKPVALLMREFEPTIVKKNMREFFSAVHAWMGERYQKVAWHVWGDGLSPTNERLVAAESDDELPTDIRRAFYRELNEIESQLQHSVSVRDTGRTVWKVFFGQEQDGLKALLDRGETIPNARLGKIQAALRGILDEDKTFEERLPDGNCHAAAQKMVAAGVAKVVIMGHTHLARNVELSGGRYLNSGTWADLIKLDKEAKDALLADNDAARENLSKWLKNLVEDRLEGIRQHDPRYADVRLDDDGTVQSATLREYRIGSALV